MLLIGLINALRAITSNMYGNDVLHTTTPVYYDVDEKHDYFS